MWVLQALLSPRMTFLDVGAHIGAFSLVGASLVGREGSVLAIEPLAPCAQAIRRNAALNALANVKVFEGALCDHSGKIGFLSDGERSSGWIATNPDRVAFESLCWSLDDFLPHAGINRAHVTKLDAGGNELLVLRGGEKTLRAGCIGTLVMKLYHPNVIQERFGYDWRESLSLLRKWGFQLKVVVRQEAFPLFHPDEATCFFDNLVYSILLVANKC